MVPDAGRMGVLSSSERLPPSAALVRAMRLSVPVHILPDGITRVALLTAAMASSGEMLILLQLVGIERDDDGPLVSAEGRRRGDAGQSGEEGAHAVEGEILHLALRVGSRC